MVFSSVITMAHASDRMAQYVIVFWPFGDAYTWVRPICRNI